MHFIVHHRQNKSKNIDNLLLCERDVYIRRLQLRMYIFRLATVNSQAAASQKNLFEEPTLYGEFDNVCRLKGLANSYIEHRLFVYINIDV